MSIKTDTLNHPAWSDYLKVQKADGGDCRVLQIQARTYTVECIDPEYTDSDFPMPAPSYGIAVYAREKENRGLEIAQKAKALGEKLGMPVRFSTSISCEYRDEILSVFGAEYFLIRGSVRVNVGYTPCMSMTRTELTAWVDQTNSWYAVRPTTTTAAKDHECAYFVPTELVPARNEADARHITETLHDKPINPHAYQYDAPLVNENCQ